MIINQIQNANLEDNQAYYLFNHFQYVCLVLNLYQMGKINLLFVVILFSGSTFCQKLKPGFDKAEYIQLLKLTAHNSNPEYSQDIPFPDDFKRVYNSPIVGLDNAWELWLSDDSVAVISIRSSTSNATSWMENFYAAMIPAKGELKLTKTDVFKYHLAEDPKATVHTGWMIGVAYLSRDIRVKIDSCYQSGVRDFYIVGHSQGGAISFLMTAYLKDLQQQGTIPQDIQFKTYCSAAPKPGNLYFAYAYEALTQNGWAYNVINSNDWVPEVPLSLQTTDDFNTINPFPMIREGIKGQKLVKRIFLKRMYNQMDKPPKKARKRYKKYLGNMLYKLVKNNLKDYPNPAYSNNNNYVRTGNTIVLTADKAYYKRFPNNPEMVMAHHSFQAYLYLMEILKY